MISTLLFLIFCSIEPVILHYLYFPKLPLGIEHALVFLFSFCLWGVIFTLPKKLIAAALVIQALIGSLLLVWHAHFANPLSLIIIMQQYREGLTFAGQSLDILKKGSLLVTLGFLVLQLFYLIRYFKFRAGLNWKLIFYIPFASYLGFGFYVFHRQPFINMDFDIYTKTLGYAQGWNYELITSYDRKQTIKDTLENIAQPSPALPPELSSAVLPNNVYLIQVESLDYAAYEDSVNGKQVMPFLQSITPDSAVYRVQPVSHPCSANADFSLMTKATNNNEFYAAMYVMLPESFYQQVVSLPEKASRLGYYNSFYHGYLYRYYNRGEIYKNFPFKTVKFIEDLPPELNTGEMGVDDADLFNYVIKDNQENPASKKFNFIITLSSHNYYQIGTKNKYPYPDPQNYFEKYVNSINYVDRALQDLVAAAPKDSLFIIYSDHTSGSYDNDKTTLLLIYSKQQPLHGSGNIEFSRITQIVHGLFEKELAKK